MDCASTILPITPPAELAAQDRKSTRLNSSHLVISYAVFCLKKKNKHAADADPTPLDPDRRGGTRREQPQSSGRYRSASLCGLVRGDCPRCPSLRVQAITVVA